MPTFQPLADTGILVTFATKPSQEALEQGQALCRSLEQTPIAGVTEWVPAYATVAIYYKPYTIGGTELTRQLETRCDSLRLQPAEMGDILTLPVWYGGTDGPDLEGVAESHGLTPERVIALHTQANYTVAMLGFLPGFAYLTGLPRELTTPRRDTPRLHVPRGSVGIAGAQTGVYPMDSPGGWQIIGRTDAPLYDPAREPPTLLRAGMRVRFISHNDN